jgi:hypothetical protein
MFQYASLYSVSKQLKLDLVFFEEYMNVFRGVKLFDAFYVNNPIIPSTDLTVYNYDIKNTLFDDTVYSLNSSKSWNINGHFHSYHYFHKNYQDILKIFNFKSEIMDMALNNIVNFRDNEPYPIVSLHVRRGDYLKLSSLNLSLSYYNNAISFFIDKLNHSFFKLLIFSDDIEWCKSHIFGENVIYSENNSNYVDMCMMSMCDHNIIANSTFSWWGAYLNTNIDKMVICPSDFVSKDSEYSFLNENYYPDNWISIQI